ncbi:MAG: hypothetical protein J6Z46_07380 [Lachnospiraceae bacterium]|nr:hypothetical protein [Lachnospiraceae bacterium]
MAESILHGGREELLTLRERVVEAEADRIKVDELLKEQSSLSKDIDARRKAMNNEIDQTIRQRKAEIENAYDKEITELNKNRKKIVDDKQKEKSVKVSERVVQETESHHEKIKALNLEIRAVARENKIPGICRYRIFYALFMPRTFADVCISIVAFIILFLLVPCAIYTILDGKPFGPTLTPAFVYAICIIIFGGIYVLVNNLIKDKHHAEIKKIIALRKEIAVTRKEIKRIKRGIEKSKDESEYGLEAYDNEISEMDSKLSGLSEEQRAALDVFNRETKGVVTDEIKGRYEPEINKLKERFDEASAEQKQISEKLRNESLELSRNYEAQLGKSNMTITTIDKLLAIFDEGRANTVAEAITVMNEDASGKTAKEAEAAAAEETAAENEAAATDIPAENETLADIATENEFAADPAPEYEQTNTTEISDNTEQNNF